MSDFKLFNQALTEYNKYKQDEKVEEIVEKIVEEDCLHNNTTNEKGIDICTDCGEEISKKITHTKEWRYYGQSDNRHSADPNRVQVRKIDDRTIFRDVDNMGFSDKIISEANELYFEVTKGQIFRGNSRKAMKKLDWMPHKSFSDLIKEIVENDLKIIQSNKISP